MQSDSPTQPAMVKQPQRNGVTMTVDNRSQVAAAMRNLTGSRVLVGIPAEKTAREGDDTGVTNSLIGYIAEFGSPAQNIPARPWLMPGIKDGEAKITTALKKTAVFVIRGDNGALQTGLEAVGLIAQTAVKNRIVSGPFAPLAPATIAARKRRGHEGIKPLIETGQFLASVSYVVTGPTGGGGGSTPTSSTPTSQMNSQEAGAAAEGGELPLAAVAEAV